MEAIPRIGEVISPKLLNLMPHDRDVQVRGQEEKKLELRLCLCPPGEHNNNNNNLNLGGDGKNNEDLGLFFFSTRSSRNNIQHKTHFDIGISDVKGEQNTTLTKKRTVPGPVVGWPPIRSFRKNIATTTSINKSPKPPTSSLEKDPIDLKSGDDGNYDHQIKRDGSTFVKINMEGVAIGRKVDLGAYDAYDNLSSAVDILFRDLLAAQRENGGWIEVKGPGGEGEREKGIKGVLDWSGEYTLVYEDNEGERMLLGDVPWHMFVSTVKRLRLLKTSELSSLRIGGRQE